MGGLCWQVSDSEGQPHCTPPTSDISGWSLFIRKSISMDSPRNRKHQTYSYGQLVHNVHIDAVPHGNVINAQQRDKRNLLTVVSAFTTLLICIGAPPSLTSLAFFLCRRLSWFFFILAISSSSLEKCHKLWVLIAPEIKDSVPPLCPRILVGITCWS